MRDVIEWRRDENFRKETFDHFIKEVACQAKKVQTEQRMLLVYDNRFRKETQYSSKKTYYVISKRQHNTVGVTGPQCQQAEKKHNEKQGKERKRDDLDAPL